MLVVPKLGLIKSGFDTSKGPQRPKLCFAVLELVPRKGEENFKPYPQNTILIPQFECPNKHPHSFHMEIHVWETPLTLTLITPLPSLLWQELNGSIGLSHLDFLILMQQKIFLETIWWKILGAYHLVRKSGNFDLKSNGKVIFRKFRSEIVEYLQRYSSFSVRNGTVEISLPFAKLSSFQSLISRKQLREIEVQMVSAISFGWFADFGKTLTIIQRSSQPVYSDKW